MRLDSNTASVFPYTFCGDCGSPYIQEFSVPIHWQMPAYYEFAGTPYVQNSRGTTTLQQFVDHKDFIWKDYYFVNRLPNGGSTLTSQAFTVSASTFYDLGIRLEFYDMHTGEYEEQYRLLRQLAASGVRGVVMTYSRALSEK